MKHLISFPIALLVAFSAFGQASLPSFANFDDPLPEGWTESLDVVVGNTRYTNGLVGAACRLDATGEYVVVNFGDVCGSITYHVKGQGTPLTNDVFTIQESANGSTWTTLRQLTGAQINNDAFQQYVDAPQGTSRYIRFFFTQKQSGRNMSIDEITLDEQGATDAQEVNVTNGGNVVFSGSEFVVGNAATTDFSIVNFNLPSGTALDVSSIVISGTHASDFSVSGVSAPFSVAANSAEAFTLNFTAGANGSRFATMTINNNDANGDETAYVIDLVGIGGNLATEPTAQATNITITDLTTYGYDVSFSAASPTAENYIVTRGINAAFLAPPVDGQTYVKGDYIDAFTQVVHVGPAGTFRPTFVVANTEYNFNVFAFNGPVGYQNYLTDSPLMGTVNTPATMMGNYYQGLDASSPNFLTELQSTISTGTNQVFYSNYSPAFITPFLARDTTDGQRVVTCVYSGYQHIFTGAFFYDVISREHTFAHSWMPTWPDEDGPYYSDLQNLFPAHQNSANAVRSNYPLGVVVDVTSTFQGAKYGNNANGQRVYEPRDQHKGDAARALFYMATRYNNQNQDWSLPEQIDQFLITYGQDQDVLKTWHWNDLPDNWEISRNDFIESAQGNRNPFIDSVDWVCRINFSNMTLIDNPESPCFTTGIEETELGSLSIVPNPSNGQVSLGLDLREAQLLQVDVMDMAGKRVHTAAINAAQGVSRHAFDLSAVPAGIYLMQVKGANAQMTQKLVIH